MPSPLLSTFHAGENRVTASTIAVLERIDMSLVSELIEKAWGETGRLTAVNFENQIALGESVPDARISARFAWWFETKVERGAYMSEGHGRTQLRAHARLLEADPDAILFVLTPDPSRPDWFDRLDGIPETLHQRIGWFSFRDLTAAIEDVLGGSRLLGEQSRFLLAELRDFYEASDLLSNDDTVVVAARYAWDEYQVLGAYVHQANRSFKDGLEHFGFYHAGRIEPLIPRIERRITSVEFTREVADRLASAADPLDARLSTVIRTAIDDGSRVEGEPYGVILLSAADDDRTLHLPRPIENDTRSRTGRRWAWTLGQRYTSSDRLQQDVHVTSELE